MLETRELDDAYVRKYARPGEDWAQAKARLTNEVAQRFVELPSCERCARDASDIRHARESHRIGACLPFLSEWPKAALEPALFQAAVTQHQQQVRAEAAIARQQVNLKLAHVDHQDHPVNALMLAKEAEGYLKSCSDLELFDRDELVAFQQATFDRMQRARLAFMQQYRDHDPDGLPWR